MDVIGEKVQKIFALAEIINRPVAGRSLMTLLDQASRQQSQPTKISNIILDDIIISLQREILRHGSCTD